MKLFSKFHLFQIVTKKLLTIWIFFKKRKYRFIFVLKYFFITLLFAHLQLFFYTFVFAMILNFYQPKVFSLMIYKHLFYGYTPKKIVYIPLTQIPRKFQRLVVELEDYRFYQHRGISLEGIRDAIRVNSKLGYAFRGGSTITQQLVRTLFLIPKKWYIRKYIEILMALELELFLSKKRILELYLNSIEWGKGIYGIGQVCSFYYKKTPSQLEKDEMARLIAIISSPIRYTPFNFEKRKILRDRYILLLSMY